MLRTKPRLRYCGLTVVLSNPSRLDTMNLLSGNGGQLFSDFCLRPEFNQMMVDVRLMEDASPLLEGTKCIMLLGQAAMHKWVPRTMNNTLNEMRGTLLYCKNIPAIASFFPQDAADLRLHEQQLNPLSKEYVTGTNNDMEDDEGDVKSHGNTQRSNYAFWLRADTRKAKQILSGGVPERGAGAVYRIYPDADEVISMLQSTKNQFLYFDIETDYEEQNLQCFSFSFDGRVILSVPILDNNYSPAYSSYHFIMRALAVAIRDNTLVAHNGAAFDFLVLGYKYHIPVGRVYDTMLAMHRCFPDVEKSLGHCTSYWTWEPFHKDEDARAYYTKEQMRARLEYCGKDVYTMFLIHQAIIKYAKTIPGLQSSIDTAMSSIRPYLITTLQGIKYDTQLLDKKRAENDRLMMQYLRMIRILIGENGMSDVRRCIKGKAGAFPSSNPQCCEYFHNILGYAVVAKGKERKDGTRGPSLAKKAMYKLRLKYENPVIDLCNIYRGVKLETTTPLGFIPWKYDNGTILNRKTYDTSKPHHIQERTDDNNPARSIIKAPEESVETCGEIDDG